MDPKKFLLMHVEKAVFVVMLGLLVLVIAVYHPWKIEVLEKQAIMTDNEKVSKAIKGDQWPRQPVDDYVLKVRSEYQVPWAGNAPPVVLNDMHLVFWNIKKGRYTPQAPAAPPVLPVEVVRAKADKGQAVIVFKIDDKAEQQALRQLGISEYQNGLKFKRIEIWRVDKKTDEKTCITPEEGWLPQGLPSRYGAPPGFIEEQPYGVPRVMGFDTPLYIYAQRRPPAGGPDPGDEIRKRMEEEMRKRADEAARRQEELQKRLAEDQGREDEIRRNQDLPPRTPRNPRMPQPGPRVPGTPRTPATPGLSEVVVPEGYYYYVDRNIAPDALYEYYVVIVCENPVFGMKDRSYDTSKVPNIVQSEPTRTAAESSVIVQSFKRWYFQGGTSSANLELGTFKVRCYVGGRQELSQDEIADIAAELTMTPEEFAKRKKKKSTGEGEAQGVWVEQNFTVRPGEEVGQPSSQVVNGQKRDIDFSTGVVLVSIQYDVQVSEDVRNRMIPKAGGGTDTEQVVTRNVNPSKLRIWYLDSKGRLLTRWQEIAPPIAGMEAPE